MNRFATKFAASTMVIAAAMVGCQADLLTSSATASTAERSEQQANRFSEQARAAAQRGDVAEALRLVERAVELAPRDAGYRMLLADLYLKSGRLQSAETSYGDVLEIDGGNVRAGLSIALVQIAQGRSGDALVTLEAIQDRAPAADVGLAFALAGQPQRGLQLLEPAARAADATGRTRQNLAFAYALAGDWQRARTVAAQDVSPAELGPRLQQWAALAQPSGQQTAVASLLGVTPVEDPGQPVRLALSAPEPAEQAYAEAAPEAQAEAAAPVQFSEADVPAPIVETTAEPVAEPVRFAEANVVVAPAPVPAAAAETVRYSAAPVAAPAAEPAAEQSGSWWPASADAEAVEAAPVSEPAPAPAAAPVRFAAASAPVSAPARASSDEEAPPPAAVSAVLSGPSPVLSRTVAPARAARPVFRPAPVNRAASVSARIPGAVAGNGAYVVQLGAFANPDNAERAWNTARQRYGLSQSQGRTASVTMGGRRLTRVSVAGFGNRSDAVRLCTSIKAQGGSCFVRGVAGDAPVPVRWASRTAPQRRG
ncbi:MAG TPA: SPOR domain-containing protein [Allosphingosinicella sp.]|jgi:Flp pilus assembly protein TadD/cell division septation protein DedD